MNKLIVAIIAGAFASTAFAQAAMQTPADKAKQNEVSATTKATAEGSDVNPREGRRCGQRARRRKRATPKALTTKQEKQAAAAATTKAGSQGATDTLQDANAANAAKAQKGTPKALPTKQDKQKAVAGTTEGTVKKDGSN